DLGEGLVGEHPPGGLVDLRAQEEVSLQGGPAQVEGPVLEPDDLVGAGLVVELEGGCVRPGEDGELVAVNLDVAGGEVGFLGPAAALDRAGDADAELGAQLAGQA